MKINPAGEFDVEGQKFTSYEEARSYAKTASLMFGDSSFAVRSAGGTVTHCQYTQGRKNWQRPELQCEPGFESVEIAAVS